MKSLTHLIRPALITATLLLVPKLNMLLGGSFNWTGSDFVAAGLLIFTATLALELILTKVPDTNRRWLLAIIVVIAFFYLWAELAVGIFTHWGN